MTKQPQKKKALEKPSMKKVPLAVDQTILANCKMASSSSGPSSFMSGCSTNLSMGQTGPCSTYGC